MQKMADSISDPGYGGDTRIRRGYGDTIGIRGYGDTIGIRGYDGDPGIRWGYAGYRDTGIRRFPLRSSSLSIVGKSVTNENTSLQHPVLN
jgi:hypothetical protein